MHFSKIEYYIKKLRLDRILFFRQGTVPLKKCSLRFDNRLGKENMLESLRTFDPKVLKVAKNKYLGAPVLWTKQQSISNTK